MGVVIAHLVSTSSWLPWLLGLVGYVFGHFLAGFLKYQKMSPKDFLAFHAPPDTTLTETNSVGMMNDALAKLKEGGFLLGFKAGMASARVNEAVWLSLSEVERTTFLAVLSRAVFMHTGEHTDVEIYTGSVETLRRIWPAPESPCISPPVSLIAPNSVSPAQESSKNKKWVIEPE